MPKQGLLVYVDGKQEESKRVLDFLRRERCQFLIRDVTESGMAEMELQAIFERIATPVVVWEGHTVHGYDEAVPATTVTSGESVTLEFTASRSGQFPIELHGGDDPEGMDVGILTVHEP